jgi:hypothetical protein
MTKREKTLRTKVDRLEAETRRLLRFETALLQVRDILAASLPPNRGVPLHAIVADILRIVEEAGFPMPVDRTIPSQEGSSGSGKAIIVPFVRPSSGAD